MTPTKTTSVRPVLVLMAIAMAATLGLSGCNRTGDTVAADDGRARSEIPGAGDTLPPVTGSETDTAATGTARNPSVTGPSGGMGTSAEDIIATDPTAAGIPRPSTGAQTVLSTMEADFIRSAASAGQYDVALAQLAAEKATDPAIKTYAAMLLEHHNDLNAQLRQMATNAQMVLPSSLPAAKERDLDRLRLARTVDFDREFIRIMTQDHRESVVLFERASREATNSELRNFAQTALPTLQAHLSEVQRLPIGATR